MRDGCVSEAGSYDDLLERDGAFAEFIKTYLQETEELSDDDMSSDGEISATCEPSFMFYSHMRLVELFRFQLDRWWRYFVLKNETICDAKY